MKHGALFDSLFGRSLVGVYSRLVNDAGERFRREHGRWPTIEECRTQPDPRNFATVAGYADAIDHWGR